MQTYAHSRLIFSLALLLAGAMTLRAQDATQATDSSSTDWQRYDWLKSDAERQSQAASVTTLSASAGQEIKDPYTVVSNGSLWQEKYDALYTRHLADTLFLSYETSATMFSDGPNPCQPLSSGSGNDLSRGQKVGVRFQPVSELTLRANVHDSMSDTAQPGDSALTSGSGFSVESRLPANTVLTLGMNSDRTGSDMISGSTVWDRSYDAQLQQPLWKTPVTAVLKGHFEVTTRDNSPPVRTPSLEQSLVWKPLEDTTVQMGLRQQQYQAYPGISNQLNDALFADLSQKILPDLSWHSYAEMLNTRSLQAQDTAPAAPIASGANGTPQATAPGSNASLNNSLPVSLDDETLTFSTGPSFKLQKDISASLEYSNRWDQNPAANSNGPEQRVSVSIKGTF